MTIVVDCRSVFRGMGGIGRATAALVQALPAAMPHAHIVLLTGAQSPAALSPEGAKARIVQTGAAMIDPAFEQLRLPALLEELGADLFHGTCFAVPLARTGVRRIATVHDAIFRRHPELVDEGLRRYLDRWTAVSCEVADRVVTVSEFSKVEIAALYGIAPERITVVPNAADERFFQAPRIREASPYVLYVGAIEEKKNVRVLVQAFAHLLRAHRELPHRLVLAGGQGGAPFDVGSLVAEAPALGQRLHLLGHIPDEHLPALYGGADLFCYLSEYEGFGLPPLEAMAVGVPTIVAHRASLPEVVGDGALLVDPADTEAVAHVIHLGLSDGGLRMRLARRGREAARRFSWRRSAEQLASLYESVLRDTPAACAGAHP